MGDLEGKTASPVFTGAKAATNALDAALRELIQQLRNGIGTHRPAALSLLEAARAAVQRRPRDGLKTADFGAAIGEEIRFTSLDVGLVYGADARPHRF